MAQAALPGTLGVVPSHAASTAIGWFESSEEMRKAHCIYSSDIEFTFEVSGCDLYLTYYGREFSLTDEKLDRLIEDGRGDDDIFELLALKAMAARDRTVW